MHNAHQLRALAVAAHCDPRTATRWLAGLTVAPLTAERLKTAAVQLGIAGPIPTLALASAVPMLAQAAAVKAG